MFQLLQGKFYACPDHNKPYSILGLTDDFCCDSITLRQALEAIPLAAYDDIYWDCPQCFHYNQAAYDNCASVLCTGDPAVPRPEAGRKGPTVDSMVATIEAMISVYPVSPKPPGEIDCLSAKELIRLLCSLLTEGTTKV